MKKSQENTPRTEWGRDHYSWPLVDSRDLGIKVEEIPPGGHSETHVHKKSRQFFFVLEGKASFLLEKSTFSLKRYEGMEVLAGKKHQIRNGGKEKLLFLLVSFPRVEESDIFRLKNRPDEIPGGEEIET